MSGPPVGREGAGRSAGAGDQVGGRTAARDRVGGLPALVLAVLAVATVAAFFFVQHIKVTTPLLTGVHPPAPPVIDPLDGACATSTVSFYLLHQADRVTVDVIARSGTSVARLATDRPMPIRQRVPAGVFRWDGRRSDGAPAPAGAYEIRVHLVGQDRTIVLGPAEGGSPYTITVRRSPRVCAAA